jgi:hypothetical protein
MIGGVKLPRRSFLGYAGGMLHFVQIVYWLALATWFGGVLFIALSAPVIFNTVRANNPILPTVLSVNLENQHATLLANSVVSALLDRLTRIEFACAMALLVAIIGHWIVIPKAGEQLAWLIVRSALYIASVVLMLYNWRVLWPRVKRYRENYIAHADEPEVANPARDDFERYHRETVTVLFIQVGLLLAMVLFSANISSARQLL